LPAPPTPRATELRWPTVFAAGEQAPPSTGGHASTFVRTPVGGNGTNQAQNVTTASRQCWTNDPIRSTGTLNPVDRPPTGGDSPLHNDSERGACIPRLRTENSAACCGARFGAPSRRQADRFCVVRGKGRRSTTQAVRPPPAITGAANGSYRVFFFLARAFGTRLGHQPSRLAKQPINRSRHGDQLW